MELNQIKEPDNPKAEQHNFAQEADLSLNLEERYKVILDSYGHKKYRKARIELNRLKCFSECSTYWKVLHLKIKCQEKIIEKKLKKNQTDYSRSSIIEWLATNEADLHYWSKMVLRYSFNERELSNKLELLITFLLNQCLFYSKYCINQGFLDDCISFLSLGENLIKRTSEFISSPDTLFLIQNIYLFFSSLYIANENYLTSKKYLVLVIKLGFKEIELRTEDEYDWMLCFDEMNIHEKEHILEILFNLTSAMYQIGVCFENEGDYKKAYQAYKQCKWFSSSFLGDTYPHLVEFIQDLYKRIKLRIDLCTFIKKEEKNIEPYSSKGLPKAKCFDNELEKIKKFEKLKKYIENLKLIEVDDEEIDLLNEVNEKPKSQRVNVATKTVNVLNHLMSSKFQDVVKEMDKIEINKLDKDTQRTIERRITSIKNTQRAKLVSDQVKSIFNRAKTAIPLHKPQTKGVAYKTATIPTTATESCLNCITQSTMNQGFSSRPQSKISHKSKIRLINYKSRPCTATSIKTPHSAMKIRNDSNIQGLLLSQSDWKSKDQNQCTFETNKSSPNNLIKSLSKTGQKKRIRPSSSKIEKIKYSGYVFNKNFRTKINYIQNQFDKELRFQKELLSSKRNEMREVHLNINQKAIKQNCETFFSNELKNQKDILKERKQKEARSILNQQANNLLKVRRGFKNIPLVTYLNPYNTVPDPSSRKEVINSDKINKYHLNQVEYELENIGKKEKYLVKKSNQLK